jgi:N-acetylmuramic acid 6-phosphate etherase
VGKGDVVVGLAASGRTPWVVGALRRARERGAATVTNDCTPASEMADLGDIAISVPVGPEVITGSTRMKAATAQKLILNMVSTTAMVRLGKVYGNLMVDLQPWSGKLRARTRRILKAAGEVSDSEAVDLLERAGGDLKVALVMAKTGKNKREAGFLLRKSDGSVRRAVDLGGGHA